MTYLKHTDTAMLCSEKHTENNGKVPLSENELWYWFSGINELSAKSRCILIETFKTPKEIFTASKASLSESGLKDMSLNSVLKSRQEVDRIKREYEDMQRLDIKMVKITDDEYPHKLKNIIDPPYCLFYRGSLPSCEKTVAIIGSRQCTEQGKDIAYSFGKVLTEYGIQVISGMALGIDGMGHRGALAAKAKVPSLPGTCAVLAGGADICYPASNRDIYTQIVKKGCVLSEHVPKTPSLSWYFPSRNRIISGLSDAVLVIEAKEKSGTFITVTQALDQGKEVFAVPGRCTDKYSAGCNELLRSGAAMATTPKDILDFFNISNKMKWSSTREKDCMINGDMRKVYDSLDFAPAHIDYISRKTGIPGEKLYSLLMKLVFSGKVKQTGSNYFRKILDFYTEA